MTRENAGNRIPRLHTVRKRMAEEVCHLVYTGEDKELRKAKMKAIEGWLEENFYGNETPAELAREWLEYDQEPSRDVQD